MIKNLENKSGFTDKQSGDKDWEDAKMFNKDLEEMKKNQEIITNAITEIKSTLEGTNSRITEAEDRG